MNQINIRETHGIDLLESLKKKYEAEIQAAITGMKIYLNNPMAIGEHPQHQDELEKFLERVDSATSKLETLNNYFTWAGQV